MEDTVAVCDTCGHLGADESTLEPDFNFCGADCADRFFDERWASEHAEGILEDIALGL